ncbi:unnamed protein product [Clonostachys solani]|uniref:DUF7582 domain-containing protein n=1 Tax=Clonostachys solani TaxID=160281 RepID=A0A9N9Z9J8_9HYPO|nr:unnamed protein product [Clonostachys solani]
MGQSWSRWKHRRSADTLRDLVPSKTPGNDTMLPKLDRKTLLSAIESVASYIDKHNSNIIVIAVGGAVNTIHLKSRKATHDVDFYNEYLSATDYELLLKGAQKAAKHNKLLEADWFNNRTVFFIPQDQRQSLSQEAYNQNEVIFQQPGLTVLAAPWYYSFCCKVDRLAGGGITKGRSYDLNDAVDYLARYLHNIQEATVPLATVKDWFQRFSLRWTPNSDGVIDQVNQAYRERYSVGYNLIFKYDIMRYLPSRVRRVYGQYLGHVVKG